MSLFERKNYLLVTHVKQKGKKYVVLQEFPFDKFFQKCQCDFYFLVKLQISESYIILFLCVKTVWTAI